MPVCYDNQKHDAHILLIDQEVVALSSSCDSLLKKKSEELKILLKEIDELYKLEKDENLNEMFFKGLSEANGFCNTLDYILRKK